MLQKFKAYCLDESGANNWTDNVFLIVGGILVGLAAIAWVWKMVESWVNQADNEVVPGEGGRLGS